jgi:hypothetical protein
MEHAALARGHWRECVGLAGGAYLLNCNLGHQLEFPVTVGFEALGVKGDSIVFFGLEAQYLCGNVLYGVQKFSVAGEEKWSIGAAEFNR